MAARYVVDASVIGHYLDPDVYTAAATNLLASLMQGDKLYIPEFCLLECTNVLWKHVRFNGLSQSKAEETIAELLELPFQIVAVQPLLVSALQSGLSHHLAVYDSLYIALALDLHCPLITVSSWLQLNVGCVRANVTHQHFEPHGLRFANPSYK